MAENFEMMSVEDINAIRNKDKEDKIDHEWANRIATVPVGAGFKLVRPDEEQQRNFKRRINTAAAAYPSFRTLDWYPQETNLPPNQEPKTYVVRVKSIDTKAKAAYEAAQNSQNGTVNGSQTTSDDSGTTDTSGEGTTAQRRRS